MKRLIAILVKALLDFDDHLILLKTVTVSEALLWWLGLLWAIWFWFMDVGSASLLFTGKATRVWSGVFGALAVWHIAGAVCGYVRMRLIASHAYAVIYLSWAFIALERPQSPLLPTFLCLSATAIVLTAKLTTDAKTLRQLEKLNG